MAWWPGIHGVMVLTDGQLGHQTKRNGTEQDNQKPNGAKTKGWLRNYQKKVIPPKMITERYMQTYQKAY